MTATVLKKLISAYRGIISPWLGTRCRFAPSCSDYAMQALDQHGAAKGSIITIKRLCRCHPWGGEGFDPVPDAQHPELRERSHRADCDDNSTTIVTPPGAHP